MTAGTTEAGTHDELAGRIDQIIGWAKVGLVKDRNDPDDPDAEYYLMKRENVDPMRDDILRAVAACERPPPPLERDRLVDLIGKRTAMYGYAAEDLADAILAMNSSEEGPDRA